jgi:hypothetical protein
MTQEEIAQLVGASRETVNKALAEFAHRGWLRLDAKTVWICDSERLARRAKLHIGLIGAHRRMGEVTNTAKVTEEIIGIGRRPLPRIRTDEVAHPQHRRHSAPRRVGREVLRKLRPPPTGQNVTQERIRIRARHTGRQIHQLAHRRVHPTSSTTAYSAFRLRILQSDTSNTQVSAPQTKRQNPAEDDAPGRGNRNRIQANQSVRQRKSLHDGAVSQADVFASNAKNQLKIVITTVIHDC